MIFYKNLQTREFERKECIQDILCIFYESRLLISNKDIGLYKEYQIAKGNSMSSAALFDYPTKNPEQKAFLSYIIKIELMLFAASYNKTSEPLRNRKYADALFKQLNLSNALRKRFDKIVKRCGGFSAIFGDMQLKNVKDDHPELQLETIYNKAYNFFCGSVELYLQSDPSEKKGYMLMKSGSVTQKLYNTNIDNTEYQDRSLQAQKQRLLTHINGYLEYELQDAFNAASPFEMISMCYGVYYLCSQKNRIIDTIAKYCASRFNTQPQGDKITYLIFHELTLRCSMKIIRSELEKDLKKYNPDAKMEKLEEVSTKLQRYLKKKRDPHAITNILDLDNTIDWSAALNIQSY